MRVGWFATPAGSGGNKEVIDSDEEEEVMITKVVESGVDVTSTQIIRDDFDTTAVTDVVSSSNNHKLWMKSLKSITSDTSPCSGTKVSVDLATLAGLIEDYDEQALDWALI